MRTWLLLASVNGFLAVLAGTVGAHGMQAAVGPQGFYGTAVLYHLVHALALLGTAILIELTPDRAGRAGRALNAAGLFFLLGIVLFSGSLYLRALTDLHMFSPLVPVGGTAFLLGWLALGVAAFPQRSKA